MELLETQDPEKKKWVEASARHKRELEKEVNAMTEKTERVLTNALIIGGSLALTYFVISRFTGGGKAKKKKEKRKTMPAGEEKENDDESYESPSLISQIGHKVINQATLILLDIAREKLAEYLHSRKSTDENS
jgi:hypothetical protein